jgi:tetratricopeptide (TPR) repeat protein
MATKEVMVTAPLMALAYDRCFLSSSWREVWRRRWRLHGALLATWSILILLLGTQSEGRQRETGFAGSVSPWHYLLTQAGAMLHYLKLAVWPRGLCFDHQDWPLVRGLADAGPSLAVMGALVVLAGIAVMRAPKLGFAALFFFAVLAPTSSFMPIVDLVEEHRTYLPLAALVTLVVVGLWAALVSRNWKLETRNSSDAQHATPFSFAGFQFPVSSFQFLVILLALTLGTLTFRRNRDYRSELTLWTDTLEKRPGNARAAMNCGAALLSADAPVEALTRLNEAIRLNPNDPMAFNNRGLAHHRLGNYEQALRDLSHAVQLGGANQVRAYNNRALTFIQLGRVDSALQDLSSAIGILPSYERPYYNRGNLFLRLGRLEEGLRDLTRAMQLAPENAAAYVDRGNLYARLGQHPQAIADFSRAIRLKPREAISYYNRANSEARMGKIREALEDLTRAVDLDPGMGEAYNNRASLWYQMGDLAAALRDIAACRSLGYIPNSNLVQMIEQAWRETVAEQLAPPPANP